MDGRRLFLLPLLALSLALAALPGLARAADSPAARWPIGGSSLRAALWLGGEHWGMTPCRGRVTLSWASLGAGTNARSSWANDRDPYLQPSFNTDCEIALSLQADWDWPKLCTVVIHEVGHLTGHDHVDDPADLMYATYVAPVPECATTPEPVETGPPPPVVAPARAPRTAAAAEEATSAKRRTPASKTTKKHKRRATPKKHRASKPHRH